MDSDSYRWAEKHASLIRYLCLIDMILFLTTCALLLVTCVYINRLPQKTPECALYDARFACSVALLVGTSLSWMIRRMLCDTRLKTAESLAIQVSERLFEWKAVTCTRERTMLVNQALHMRSTAPYLFLTRRQQWRAALCFGGLWFLPLLLSPPEWNHITGFEDGPTWFLGVYWSLPILAVVPLWDLTVRVSSVIGCAWQMPDNHSLSYTSPTSLALHTQLGPRQPPRLRVRFYVNGDFCIEDPTTEPNTHEEPRARLYVVR